MKNSKFGLILLSVFMLLIQNFVFCMGQSGALTTSQNNFGMTSLMSSGFLCIVTAMTVYICFRSNCIETTALKPQISTNTILLTPQPSTNTILLTPQPSTESLVPEALVNEGSIIYNHPSVTFNNATYNHTLEPLPLESLYNTSHGDGIVTTKDVIDALNKGYLKVVREANPTELAEGGGLANPQRLMLDQDLMLICFQNKPMDFNIEEHYALMVRLSNWFDHASTMITPTNPQELEALYAAIKASYMMYG